MKFEQLSDTIAYLLSDKGSSIRLSANGAYRNAVIVIENFVVEK
jgi:hypothetical protein